MQMELRSEVSVSEVIVRAVAEETGRDTMEMRPLGESIDTDAIESLFTESSGNDPRTLTVEYEGCRVIIDRDAVTAEPLVTA